MICSRLEGSGQASTNVRYLLPLALLLLLLPSVPPPLLVSLI
jgi:hypothetical protein